MAKLNTEVLSKELDIDIIPEENPLVVSGGLDIGEPGCPEPTTPTELCEDAEYAQENIRQLITEGTKALNDFLTVAKMKQEARAYEVAATLLKTISELNKDLLEIHKRKADIEDQTGKSSTKINVDKAIVFSGSTAEFIKLIKKTTDDITG